MDFVDAFDIGDQGTLKIEFPEIFEVYVIW